MLQYVTHGDRPETNRKTGYPMLARHSVNHIQNCGMRRTSFSEANDTSTPQWFSGRPAGIIRRYFVFSIWPALFVRFSVSPFSSYCDSDVKHCVGAALYTRFHSFSSTRFSYPSVFPELSMFVFVCVFITFVNVADIIPLSLPFPRFIVDFTPSLADYHPIPNGISFETECIIHSCYDSFPLHAIFCLLFHSFCLF